MIHSREDVTVLQDKAVNLEEHPEALFHATLSVSLLAYGTAFMNGAGDRPSSEGHGQTCVPECMGARAEGTCLHGCLETGVRISDRMPPTECRGVPHPQARLQFPVVHRQKPLDCSPQDAVLKLLPSGITLGLWGTSLSRQLTLQTQLPTHNVSLVSFLKNSDFSNIYIRNGLC